MSLRDQLAAVYESRGLTSETLVAAATPEDHPLHDRFEWDDSIAGHQFRLVQAAELIRSVKVTYGKDTEGRAKTVRAFSSVYAEGSPVRAYVPTEEAMADPFLREMLLRECRREWARFEGKYSGLVEFAAIVSGSTEATG